MAICMGKVFGKRALANSIQRGLDNDMRSAYLFHLLIILNFCHKITNIFPDKTNYTTYFKVIDVIFGQGRHFFCCQL